MKPLLFLSIALLLSACERPNPAPENMDPIYRDLGDQIALAEGAIKKAAEDLKSARHDLGEARPQTADRKRAMAKIERAQKAAVLAEQQKFYLELRRKERQILDRKSYLSAFHEKKPWPPKEEGAQYQIQRRLETASRNWEDRVPKSREVLAKRKPAQAKPAKKSGGH